MFLKVFAHSEDVIKKQTEETTLPKKKTMKRKKK